MMLYSRLRLSLVNSPKLAFPGTLALTVFGWCCLSFVLSPSVTAQEDANELTESVMFDMTQLLEIEVTIDDADWEVLCAQTRNFAESITKEAAQSPFTYFKGSVSINGVEIPNVGIRKKGFIGSLDSFRPSLKIKFDEYEKRDLIAGVDRLTLNNNKQDPSQLSAILSYKLFRAAGVPAPRCNLARVTVNGKYLGIYSNVESTKDPFLEKHFGSIDGNLYEGTVADFFPDRLDRFELKTNEKRNDLSDLKGLAEILDGPEEGLVERIKEVVDYDRFLRFWAIESLIGFWDGYSTNQNNYFIYNDPTNGKFTFVPWGTDSSFARAPSILYKPGPESVRTGGRLAYLLYLDESVRNEYRDLMFELLDSVWQDEELNAFIDQHEALVAEHVGDFQGDFESDLRSKRRFIEGRREQIMDEMADGPVEATWVAREPIYFNQEGTLEGKFETVWKNNRNANAYRSGETDAVVVQDGAKVEFTRMGVKAEPGMQMFGGSEGDRDPPTIVFTGERTSDGKSIIFAVSVDPDSFNGDQDGEIEAGGVMIEGFNFSFGGEGGMRFMAGTITLDEASEEDGAPVSGTVSMKIFSMKNVAQ